MNEQYPEDWTLDNHLLHGRSAIEKLNNVPTTSISGPRVCFHLLPLSRVDDEKWGMEAGYCRSAKRAFDECTQEFDVDYVGGHCGIEAWQYAMPDEGWLAGTVPLIWNIAVKAELSFEGWSFEPASGPYLSVSPTVNVYNGNKLAELPPSATAQFFARLSNWFRSKLENDRSN